MCVPRAWMRTATAADNKRRTFPNGYARAIRIMHSHLYNEIHAHRVGLSRRTLAPETRCQDVLSSDPKLRWTGSSIRHVHKVHTFVSKTGNPSGTAESWEIFWTFSIAKRPKSSILVKNSRIRISTLMKIKWINVSQSFAWNKR